MPSLASELQPYRQEDVRPPKAATAHKAAGGRYDAPRFGTLNYYCERVARYCTAAEQVVFIALWRNANEQNVTFASIRTLAEETGFHKSTVLAAINGDRRRHGLVAAGLLVRHKAATSRHATRWQLVDVQHREFSARDFTKTTTTRRKPTRDPRTGQFSRPCTAEREHAAERSDVPERQRVFAVGFTGQERSDVPEQSKLNKQGGDTVATAVATPPDASSNDEPRNPLRFDRSGGAA